MIDRDDLRAAVGAGLLSERQAAGLLALAGRRLSTRAATRAVDEPFELFRGFNEIFIVVGLAILASGWLGVWALIAGTSNGFGTVWAVAGIVTAALIGLLSEYFVRRRRMVAPAIALAAAWSLNALWFWMLRFDSFTLLGGVETGVIAYPLLLTVLTIGAYWLRYRVPFAMALGALAAFGAVISALAAASGRTVPVSELFLLSASGPFAWGTLLFGLVLFAAAMRFDMSDPDRLTLRSANGFWLHVVAAPAIVNTLALTLIDAGGPVALLLLAVLLAAIAAVAVVIDRRSFLISAVGYVVALISLVTEGVGSGAVAVLLLGAGLVGLGSGWQGVRRRLVPLVPDRLRAGLPPSA